MNNVHSIDADGVALSVYMSLCLLATIVSMAQTDEPIENKC